MNDSFSSKTHAAAVWVRRVFLAAAAVMVQASCSHPGPPPVYVITHTIPAGSRIEYYAQVPDESWQLTQKVKPISRPMAVKEAEKWAISAARTRLGDKWKDYSIRVFPPGENAPVVVWRRSPVYQY